MTERSEQTKGSDFREGSDYARRLPEFIQGMIEIFQNPGFERVLARLDEGGYSERQHCQNDPVGYLHAHGVDLPSEEWGVTLKPDNWCLDLCLLDCCSCHGRHGHH